MGLVDPVSYILDLCLNVAKWEEGVDFRVQSGGGIIITSVERLSRQGEQKTRSICPTQKEFVSRTHFVAVHAACLLC